MKPSKFSKDRSQTLLIIYTGGTIGMQHSDRGYVACADINDLFLKSLSASTYSSLMPFEVVEFERLIDSSNAQPNDWLNIARCIRDNYAHYCGFIVLHGTDTMAYTAAALHHIFGSHTKPIIVTGSQIPMSHPRSDAMTNLIDAIAFCRAGQISQVCLSFAGKLLPAKSAKKVHSSALAAFDSFNATPMASAAIEIKFTATQQPKPVAKELHISLPQSICGDSVKLLHIHPGISKAVIDAVFLSESTKAVVILTYGAGNPPDQNRDLIQSLTRARQKEVVVLNITQCYGGAVTQGVYAVSSILNQLGVISAGDRTLEDVMTDLYINLDQYIKHKSGKPN